MLRMRPRPRCSLSELVSMVTGTASNPGMVTGRGSSECEMQKGVVGEGDRVLIVDDLLATGANICIEIFFIDAS